MNEEIRIWEIDDPKKGGTPVEPIDQTDTEHALEEALVKSPDMLMQGLTLVGRQTPTDSGNLDLLGVDDDGRLVVFELKRGKLTRDAIVQILDYCSWLESMTETELASHIASRSGTGGLEKIDDFETWYGIRRSKQLVELRPIRMVLVGLGADTHTLRMVDYLAQRNVDITLLTFHGYKHGGKTLLARQIEGGEETHETVPGGRASQAELRTRHAESAKERGMEDLWREAVSTLSIPFTSTATQSGITFSLTGITLPDSAAGEEVRFRASHSVAMDEDGRIRVTFYPVAVHLCRKKFEEKKEWVGFQSEKPLHAPTTDQVTVQWYCQLGRNEWNTHEEALKVLVKEVHAAWQGVRGQVAEA